MLHQMDSRCVVPGAEKGLGPAAANLADDLTPCIGTGTPASNPVPALSHPGQQLPLQLIADVIQ